MTQFMLNGKPLRIDTSQDQRVQEFMEHVRKQLNSETSVISMIRINGHEVTESNEAAVANILLSEVDSIEVFTEHPRELAEATLQTLMEYAGHLEKLSKNSAKKLQAGTKPEEFMKLIDGIETFTDALIQVKGILRVGIMDPINVLEADLASILKDVVDFTQNGQRDYVIDLLENHLPLNLQDWRTQGIPTLIRSRDS